MAEARTGFVDRVIHDFVDEMVQPARRGVADIHARALADVLDPLQYLDHRLVVVRRTSGGHVLRMGLLPHVRFWINLSVILFLSHVANSSDSPDPHSSRSAKNSSVSASGAGSKNDLQPLGSGGMKRTK